MTEAQETLAAAKETVQNARAILVEKEEKLTAAREKQSRAQAITFEDAMETPVMDEDFLYLNDLIATIREKQKVYADFAEKSVRLEKTLADRFLLLQEAEKAYARAVAELTFAQADYDRFLQQSEAEEMLADSDAGASAEQDHDGVGFQVETEDQGAVVVNDFSERDNRHAYFQKGSSFVYFLRTSERMIRENRFGTLTISNPEWYSFDRKTLDALRGRSDMSLTIIFQYMGKKYSFVIPAGFDLDLLQDSDGWYGFMYLNGVFGGQEIV